MNFTLCSNARHFLVLGNSICTIINLYQILLFSVAQQPNSDPGRLVVVVFRFNKIKHRQTHTHTHTHTRYDPSVQVISSSQKPLPTQHITNTMDEHPCSQWDCGRRTQNWDKSEDILQTLPALYMLKVVNNTTRYKKNVYSRY